MSNVDPVKTYLLALQNRICAQLEQLDGKSVFVHDAWERPDTPDPLPMPLQGYLTFDATRRTNRYVGVGETRNVAFAPVGQVVGQIQEIETCRDIMERLLTEYGEAYERIQSLMPE